MTPGDILTVAEAAKVLRCGPKSIRRLCRLRTLPHRVIDQKGSIRISRQAIDAFLLGQKAAR